MLSRDHNILWLPESNGYPTRAYLATRFRKVSENYNLVVFDLRGK